MNATWLCGVMVYLPDLAVCIVNRKVGGSYRLLGSTMDVYHHTLSCMVFCKTFYYQEMARIYPPNAQNSECQIFYFLTFSAERSKFLERTLVSMTKLQFTFGISMTTWLISKNWLNAIQVASINFSSNRLVGDLSEMPDCQKSVLRTGAHNTHASFDWQ